MTAYEVVAQSVGIVAMTMNMLSFQQKEQRKLIVMQFFGSALFAVNMFMLGAFVGGFLNLIGAFRAIVYSNKEKFRADSKWWIFGFSCLYLLSYFLTFAVFDKETSTFNLVIEFLPIIAMLLTNIGFACKEAKSARILGLISCPCWLIYNISNFVLGGMICDTLVMISIIIGIVRLDIRRKNNDT